ncbi:MAG: NADH-quinone oxidoreductase subunit M [Planctomycetota bacterium]|nr:MAG: NADH-quinone oxidoreductase subunit M [Planctomycetota bacterium]REK25501.1 MAG: NADH-quinone oxidoreductase subunit M [Planctomycetota bacterium]REK45935.1 MAG: NADH-quinone oxidoreductase subunit M [Planctomycetota bacterium]
MENAALLWLSVLVFLPAAGALFLMLPIVPRSNPEAIKRIALGVTLATLVVSILLAIPGMQESSFSFDPEAVNKMQSVFNVGWIPTFNIEYFMGFDGISFPLVLLTTFISVLAMAASWPINKYVRAYCVLFLLLETGMIGVFLALDFFLFYVFWEVMLLPMYFLIGVWGGPRKEYAAIKFFLYTLLGSVLMLIAILMLYFKSDLKVLAESSAIDNGQLVAAGLVTDAAQADAWRAEMKASEGARHTFNILALQLMGQHTELFSRPVFGEGGYSLQWWAFVLLFIGFAIKVPSVPVHTWLPDAHVEAPTPISMILAGVLLKMGGYGIIRICYPICPEAAFDLAWWVCGIGALSMVYGAFAALAQKDFKRLVAYSSVSHMGYVILGIGVASVMYGGATSYWSMGMNGAMFQMIAHGISSAGMFFLVGVVYDRVHHRELDKFGGLFGKMPVYSGLAIVIFFAGLGLPGLCGFIGEVLVVLSVWPFSKTLAIISAAVVILTAAYILWTLQRVYLGPEYKGPHGEALTPITAREWSIAVPLVIFAILFGVYPRAVLDYMEPSVSQTVEDLTQWGKANNFARDDSAEGEAAEVSLERRAEPAAKPAAPAANREARVNRPPDHNLVRQ